MEQKLKKVLKSLKVNEGLISTIMGGVVVVVMAAMIFNYFKSINKNGLIADQAAQESAEEQLSKDLPTTYKVKKGDDLWKISERFYNSGYNFVDIAVANKLANASLIEVDQELVIPRVEPKKATVVVATEKKEAVTEVANEKTSIEGDKYTTVKGDYLWNIAVRAYGDGYAWTKIYTANKAKIGVNPSVLFTGIELVLPR